MAGKDVGLDGDGDDGVEEGGKGDEDEILVDRDREGILDRLL